VGRGPFPEVRRRKGPKAEGQRYEKKLARKLSLEFPTDQKFFNQWIEYADVAGRGFAQPDAIVLLPEKRALLIECKLRRCADGPIQLQNVYLPLVQKLWPGRRWWCVNAVKYWEGAQAGVRIVTNIHAAFNEPEDQVIDWHIML
jgi:hypothetical protein